VELDLTLVAALRTRQDLHQRGLAGTVLAHQRVNLSWLDGQRDVAQRLDTWIALGDVPHLQQRCGQRSAQPPVFFVPDERCTGGSGGTTVFPSGCLEPGWARIRLFQNSASSGGGICSLTLITQRKPCCM